jgi:hypothetical protein
MEWNELTHIIEDAGIQLDSEQWLYLQESYLDWKENKELVLSDEELEEIGSL